jgi:hypothetical protein
LATMANTASERPTERRRRPMAVEELVQQQPGEVSITGGHRSIGGSGLGVSSMLGPASQLNRQCLDDAFELARALEIRDLAEPGDDPVPGLARLVSIGLGQGEIAVSLLPATDRSIFTYTRHRLMP